MKIIIKGMIGFEILIYGMVVIFILLSIAALIIDRRRWKKFRNTTFKVAEVSDNLGNFKFKIVGKNSNGDFQELSDFILFETSIWNHIPKSAGESFLSQKLAEKELNNFLIQIGQLEYKKEIKILDNYEDRQTIL